MTKTMTTGEVAAFLNIKRNSVHSLGTDGKIQRASRGEFKPGAPTKWFHDSVVRYAAERRGNGNPQLRPQPPAAPKKSPRKKEPRAARRPSSTLTAELALLEGILIGTKASAVVMDQLKRVKQAAGL